MFTRTAQEVPEREKLDPETIQLCPPHDFESGWCSPLDAKDHDDTVPGLFCRACGSIRAFKILAD